jgi:hypothetical protein
MHSSSAHNLFAGVIWSGSILQFSLSVPIESGSVGYKRALKFLQGTFCRLDKASITETLLMVNELMESPGPELEDNTSVSFPVGVDSVYVPAYFDEACDRAS